MLGAPFGPPYLYNHHLASRLWYTKYDTRFVFSVMWYFMSLWEFSNDIFYEGAHKYCHPKLYSVHTLLIYIFHLKFVVMSYCRG